MTSPTNSWSVPVRIEDVPETGLAVHLSADAPIRDAIARLGGLNGLPRLDADFTLERHGHGVHVVGTVSATVGQTCVVTLEPMESEIAESVDLLFSPDGTAASTRDPAAPDPPEPLVDGTVDLGGIATEFLLLGIDPYPRRPGVTFESPNEPASDTSPFAALAALKPGR